MVKSINVGLMHINSVETFNQYYEIASPAGAPSQHFSGSHGGMITELEPHLTREASLRLPGIHPLSAKQASGMSSQRDDKRIAQDEVIATILKEAGEPEKGEEGAWGIGRSLQGDEEKHTERRY